MHFFLTNFIALNLAFSDNYSSRRTFYISKGTCPLSKLLLCQLVFSIFFVKFSLEGSNIFIDYHQKHQNNFKTPKIVNETCRQKMYKDFTKLQGKNKKNFKLIHCYHRIHFTLKLLCKPRTFTVFHNLFGQQTLSETFPSKNAFFSY